MVRSNFKKGSVDYRMSNEYLYESFYENVSVIIEESITTLFLYANLFCLIYELILKRIIKKL